MKLRAHALAVDLPPKWEGRIFRHPGGEPTMHAANFALPAEDGDFGAKATGSMKASGAFISLTEYDPDLADTALFHRRGMPRTLHLADLSPRALMRGRPGQAGVQRFFHAKGRAFCLYVVVGHQPTRGKLVLRVNDVLQTVEIDRRTRS